MAIIRPTRRRTVPERATATRSRLDTMRRATGTQRARIQADARKQLTQFLQDVQKQTGEILKNTNINQLDSEANRLLLESINNIPPQYRSQVKSTINNVVSRLKKEHQNQIDTLTKQRNDVQSYRREVIKEGGNLKLRTALTEELRAINDVLRELRRGSIIGQTEISKFIGERVRKREEFESAVDKIVEQRQGMKKAQEFITQEAIKGKTVSIKDVRDKFGITTSQASDIVFSQSQIKKLQDLIDSSFQNRKLPSVDELKRFNITEEQAKELQSDIKKALKETRPAEEIVRIFSDNMIKAIAELNIPERTITSTKTLSDLSKSGASSKDIQNYNALTPRERNILQIYANVKNAQRIAQEQDLSQYKEQDKFFSDSKKLYELLKSDLKYVDLPPVKELEVVVTKTDENNIKFLKGLTDKKLLDLINEGNIDRVNNAIQSINNIYEKAERTQQFFIDDIIKSLEKKAKPDKIGLNILINSFPPISGVKSAKRLALSSLRIELQEMQGKNGTITFEEYKTYLGTLEDVFGFKTIGRTTARIIDNRFKNEKTLTALKNTVFDATKLIGRFTYRTAVNTVKLIGNIISLGDKLVRGTLNFTSKFRIAFYEDATDTVLRIMNRLPKKDQTRFFNRTRNEYSKLYSDAKTFTNNAINIITKNPEIIVSAVAIGISNGAKGFRSAMIKDPVDTISKVTAFFALGTVIKTAIKLAKSSGVLFKKLKGLSNNYRTKPSKNFRFAVQDSSGKILYFNKKGLGLLTQKVKTFNFFEIKKNLINKRIIKELDALRKAGKIKTDEQYFKTFIKMASKPPKPAKKGFKDLMKIPSFKKVFDSKLKALKDQGIIKSIKKYKLNNKIISELERLRKAGKIKTNEQYIKKYFELFDKKSPMKLLSGKVSVSQKFKTFLTQPKLRSLITRELSKLKRDGLIKTVSSKLSALRKGRLNKSILKDLNALVKKGTIKTNEQYIKTYFDMFRKRSPVKIAVKKVPVSQKFKTFLTQPKLRSLITRELSKLKRDGLIKTVSSKLNSLKAGRIEKRILKQLNKLVKEGKIKTNEQYIKTYFELVKSKGKPIVKITLKEETKLLPSAKKQIAFNKLSPARQDKILKDNIKIITKPKPKKAPPSPKKGDIVFQRFDDKGKIIVDKNGNIYHYKAVEKIVGNQVLIQYQFVRLQKVKLKQKAVTLKLQQKVKPPKSKQKLATLKKKRPLRAESRTVLLPTNVKAFPTKFLYAIAILGLEKLEKSRAVSPRLKRVLKKELKKFETSRFVLKPVQKISLKPAKVLKPVLKKKLEPARKLRFENVQIIKPKPAKPIKPKIPVMKLNFNKPLRKGNNFLVNGLVRVKGRVKEIPLKTTINRAFNYMSKLIDHTTARSFELRPVGITKAKDVKPKGLNKFRFRKTPKALKYVEKNRYLIDTRGEKIGLTIARLLKSGTNKKRSKSRNKRTVRRNNKKKR